MTHTGYRTEVEDVTRVKIKVITIHRGRLRIHLLECSRCGPVAIDSTDRSATEVGRDHLLLAHNLGGVPV